MYIHNHVTAMSLTQKWRDVQEKNGLLESFKKISNENF